MTNLTHVYVPLTKAEKQADGTMLVSGPATSSALDRDLQVCDPSWLDTAMPKWFGESGNIREMHTAIAAGKALSYEKRDGGQHWVEALVVDPSSVAKVEHGVLTGFSIGIKGARVVKSDVAPNGSIIDGSIIEVSLVDRPANPECLLEIAKSDELGIVSPVETQALVEGAAVAEIVTDADPVVVDLTETGTGREVAVEAAPVMEAAHRVRESANEVLAAIASWLPEGVVEVKADEAGTITGAKAAVAAIARLIEQEAKDLANGDMTEAYDIDCLLEAVNALRWFIAREEAEGNPDVLLADQPEETKGDTPEEIASTEEASEAVTVDATKSEGVDGLLAKFEARFEERISAAVTEALAKAEESHGAAIKSLRDELAEVKAQPIPGGPVRVRTSVAKSLADDVDRNLLLTQAAEFDAKAERSQDRMVAEGYRALAAEKRVAAAR
jgi:hypothetical protein